MGLQHYNQDMSKIPIKYNINVLFTQSIHTLRLSVGGRTDGRTHGRMDGWTDARTHGRTDGRTHGRKIFTQYSGISSCSVGSTYYLIKASIFFYSHLSPNLTALETIRYRPPCALSVVCRPVLSIPRRSRMYSVGCCVYLSIGGRLRPRRILFFLLFCPLI